MEIQAAFKTTNKGDRDYVRYQVINEKIRHHHENVSQIAGRCGVSLATVHKHLKSLYGCSTEIYRLMENE